MAPRLRALLPVGLGEHRRAAGEGLRHGDLGLRRLRPCRPTHPCDAGHRHHHDTRLRLSLFRAVAALPRRRRRRRSPDGGPAADADPPHRHLQPVARARRRRRRRDRALLGLGADMAMLELYELAGAEEDRRFSPFCWRTRLALAHKGLPVETIPWRFTEKDRIAPSGQGRGPGPVDDRRWIADSLAPARPLEQAHPHPPPPLRHAARPPPTPLSTTLPHTPPHPS